MPPCQSVRLKNKSETPVGGLWYGYEDDSGRKYRVNGYECGWSSFVQKVKMDMTRNNVAIPAHLEIIIEDQICMRQPAGKCWYSAKAGDQIAKVAHIFARTIDAAAKAIGVESNLEEAARGCKRCAKRRNKLNT